MQAHKTTGKKQSVQSNVTPLLRPNTTKSYLRKHSTLSTLSQQGWSKAEIERRSSKIIAYYTKDRVLGERDSPTKTTQQSGWPKEGQGGQVKLPKKTQ